MALTEELKDQSSSSYYIEGVYQILCQSTQYTLRHFTQNHKYQPRCGTIEEKSEGHKSHLWIFLANLIAIHPTVVEIFQSGPQCIEFTVTCG